MRRRKPSPHPRYVFRRRLPIPRDNDPVRTARLLREAVEEFRQIESAVQH